MRRSDVRVAVADGSRHELQRSRQQLEGAGERELRPHADLRADAEAVDSSGIVHRPKGHEIVEGLAILAIVGQLHFQWLSCLQRADDGTYTILLCVRPL